MLKLRLLNRYIKKKADLVKVITDKLAFLTAFQIYKRFINDKLLNHVNDILFSFVSTYRSKYSSNHMIMRLTEEKRKLNKGFFAGIVLMDLSRAFDCISHDLQITKLNAYSSDSKSLVFFYSYLRRRKQCVNANNIQSTFQALLSEVPQGSIFGLVLFNIFINNLIGFIKKSSLYCFADDNTITDFEKDITLLKETLQNETEIAIQWFKDNLMIVNCGKFQAMVINTIGKMENKHDMYIENKEITLEHSVKLLGIEIYNQLNFDNHVSILCKKAGSQLNAICRLRKIIHWIQKMHWFS